MNRFLAMLFLCGMVLSLTITLAHADPQSDQQRRKALLPQVRVTTDCITAQTANEFSMAIEQNPTVAQMVDRVLKRGSCFPHLRLLIEQHDRLMGPGSGQAFVNGPYLADLPRAVSVRLQIASKANGDQPSPTVTAIPSRNVDTRSSESPSITVFQNAGSSLQPSISKNAQPASTTVSDRLKGIEDDDSFRKGLSLIFVTLAASTVILFVLGCGSRVVVFADARDVFMSVCIFLVPVMTLFAAGMIGWMLAPENTPKYASTFEMAFDNPAPTFVLCVGALAWVWAILGTIYNSIRYNGIIVGPIISVLKLCAMLSLMLVWFGTLHNYDEEGNENHIAAKFFVFAILVWFASKFVNGDRVMERRMVRMHQRDTSDVAIAGA